MAGVRRKHHFCSDPRSRRAQRTLRAFRPRHGGVSDGHICDRSAWTWQECGPARPYRRVVAVDRRCGSSDQASRGTGLRRGRAARPFLRRGGDAEYDAGRQGAERKALHRFQPCAEAESKSSRLEGKPCRHPVQRCAQARHEQRRGCRHGLANPGDRGCLSDRPAGPRQDFDAPLRGVAARGHGRPRSSEGDQGSFPDSGRHR